MGGVNLKAFIIAIILSISLVWLGFQLGTLNLSAQLEQANEANLQATDKVLILAQEKQKLEERLLNPSAVTTQQPGEVWPVANGLQGLVHLGRKTFFGNSQVYLELMKINSVSGQAQIKLSVAGHEGYINLEVGSQSQFNDQKGNYWRLILHYLAGSWCLIEIIAK